GVQEVRVVGVVARAGPGVALVDRRGVEDEHAPGLAVDEDARVAVALRGRVGADDLGLLPRRTAVGAAAHEQRDVGGQVVHGRAAVVHGEQVAVRQRGERGDPVAQVAAGVARGEVDDVELVARAGRHAGGRSGERGGRRGRGGGGGDLRGRSRGDEGRDQQRCGHGQGEQGSHGNVLSPTSASEGGRPDDVCTIAARFEQEQARARTTEEPGGPQAAGLLGDQAQVEAPNVASTSWEPAAATAVPSSTADERAENDWYADLPGCTAGTVRSPYGVRSVTSTASAPVFCAVTATYAVPARQRVDARTSSAGAAADGSSTAGPSSSTTVTVVPDVEVHVVSGVN